MMEQCKEKLNIAMFGQKRIPSREGGVEIVVEELCSRMVAQGYNVTCYNRGGHHVSGSEYDSKRLKEYKGIRLKTVPTIEKKGLAAVSSSFFAALCCAFGRYDIVHIHAEGPAFFAWLPKLFGKKVIVTIHGLDWQREKWKSGFGSKFIHHGEKNAVKYADEIIVLSKGVQDYFEKEYGRKTVFIPNGVNRPKIQEAELITEKYGLEKDSYILFLGRLVPEKGIKYRHTWNIVKINGIYYHLDATFDNSLGKDHENKEIRYDYFNLDDQQIFRDHEPLIAPAPHCNDHDHFYYKEKKLSFTKQEDVYKRSLQAAKKGKVLVFHWRGGYLTKEVLNELLDLIRKAGMEKEKNAMVSINWPQAVLRVQYADIQVQESVMLEEANEGEKA